MMMIRSDAGDDDYTVIDLSYRNGAFGVLLGQVDMIDVRL